MSGAGLCGAQVDAFEARPRDRRLAPLTECQVRAELERAVEGAGGVRAFGRLHGLSAPYVSDLVLGRRAVSERVANALGYVRQETRTVVFVPVRRTRP